MDMDNVDEAIQDIMGEWFDEHCVYSPAYPGTPAQDLFADFVQSGYWSANFADPHRDGFEECLTSILESRELPTPPAEAVGYHKNPVFPGVRLKGDE